MVEGDKALVGRGERDAERDDGGNRRALIGKYVETRETDWFARLVDARLEKDESPEELKERQEAFNENSGKKMGEKEMRKFFLKAISGGSEVMVACAG